MHAANIDDITCVKKLIEKGASLNTVDGDGQTVWSLAAETGNVDLLKCLLEGNGIDQNSTDKHGLSMLYWAVYRNTVEVVNYLLNLGVSKSQQSHSARMG